MYNEQDYSTAGQITAYNIDGINFTQPMRIHRRYLQATGDYSMSGTAISLPLSKSVGASISESEEHGTDGTTYKVNVQFAVSHNDKDALSTVECLRTAKHLVLTHLGGAMSIIRATEEGWKYDNTIEDGQHIIKLTIHNVNGQQKVLD